MRPHLSWPSVLTTGAAALTALFSVVPPSGASQLPGGTHVVNTAAGLAAYRANRAAAEHEARDLLALARLKPGAKRLEVLPSWYPSPALPYPATADMTIAQVAGYWSVPAYEPPGSGPVPWYPPDGLALNGEGTGYEGEGVSSINDLYWAKATGQWQSAELSFTEVDDDGTAAAVQVAAVVAWLDPRPMVDDATGPRDHPGVGQPCPSNVRDVAGVSNPAAYATVLRARLLPPGPVDEGLLCMYDLGDQGGLYRSVRLLGPALGRWVSTARRVSLSHTDGLVSSCPFGSAAGLLALSYPRPKPHSIDLWLSLTGCGSVANGYVTASAGNLAVLARPYLPPPASGP